MKINGINTINITKLNRINIANVNKLNRITIGGAPPVPISLDDRTRTALLNTSFTTGTPFTINLPPTAVEGDLVFIFIASDNVVGSPMFEVPTGWTEHFSAYGTIPDNTIQLWSKILSLNDENAGTVSVYPLITTNRDMQCWSMIGTGIDTSNPVSNVGTKVESQGTTMTIPAITPTYDGLAVGFWGYDGGDGEPTTITSGWTKLEESDADPSFSGLLSGFGSKDSTAGVSTGNLAVTFLLNDGFCGCIVNLKAA